MALTAVRHDMHLSDLPASDDADYLAQFAERLYGSDILARYGVGVFTSINPSQ